jgi:hypothetical protein
MPINKIQFQPGLSLPDFFAQFGTEAQCEKAPEKTRWPSGFVCPGCGGSQHSLLHRDGEKLWHMPIRLTQEHTTYSVEL